jgi:hypothetical protein
VSRHSSCGPFWVELRPHDACGADDFVAAQAGALYRSTELSPAQQAERIVAINDRLQLDTHDAERIANDALAAR